MENITVRLRNQTAPARRGRPRSEATDRAIFEAALDLMARDGYARMSVDAVAAEAGVSKPTVYRRHRGKEALATAALAHLRERTAPPETGETGADLVAQLRHFRAGIERPFGMTMLGTVLAEEHHTPELLARFRERLVQPRRRMVRSVLERAQARGELPAGAELDTPVAMLIGSYYAHYLAQGGVPADWPESAVGPVLRGLEAA
jgi:AcrR family transcriptional regulator